MPFGQCKRCKEYRFGPQNCTCRPFTAWLGDDQTEEEGIIIYANDTEVAAEKFAKEYDYSTADYSIAHSGGADVLVRDNDTGNTDVFFVEVCIEPIYTARR
jgi:hypothetical protein